MTETRLACFAFLAALSLFTAATSVHAEDLGNLSANPYDPESTSNRFGRYGSPFSPDSLNNQYGAGNPIGLIRLITHIATGGALKEGDNGCPSVSLIGSERVWTSRYV